MRFFAEGENYSIICDTPLSKLPKEIRDLPARLALELEAGGPFAKLISKVLGKGVHVSIVFVRKSKIKNLNKEYRGKDSSTDVLSFKSKTAPEILFSLTDVRRKAREFEISAPEYLSYLLIHALLHLKGIAHSSKMNSKEKELCRYFKIQYPFK